MPTAGGKFSEGTLERVCLCILAILAIFTAMIYAKPIIAPIALGLVLGVVISPVSERLFRIGIPRVVLALGIVLLLLGILIAFALYLGPVFDMLARRLPQIMSVVSGWLDGMSGILRGIEVLNEELEKSVGNAGSVEGTDLPSLTDALWFAPNFGAQVFTFVGTLFFFVLTRDQIYSKFSHATPILLRADRAVSRYFGAVTAVNATLGGATALALTVIGVENAVLWGLAAAMLNYMLYLGPIMIMSGLLIAGILQFEGALVVLPPFAFFVLNLIEAQFVTPMVVGQHVSINPLIVFLAIVSGLWLWGPVGAIVALPALLWISTVWKDAHKLETADEGRLIS